MATRQDFELAFRLLLGHEGEFSNVHADPGNWTGGRVGQGTLKGTKWGISAAAYPHLDIRNLTQAQAHDIYERDYWNKVDGSSWPPRTAFVVFDAAVNNGPARAIRWLQQAAGAAVDGVIGPQTRLKVSTQLARSAPRGESLLIVEFCAHRLRFMAELSTWNTFRGGWSRRLVQVPFEAAAYWPQAT